MQVDESKIEARDPRQFSLRDLSRGNGIVIAGDAVGPESGAEFWSPLWSRSHTSG